RKFRDTKTGILSSGEQTRVGLAKAMLNRPRILLLDEPTASIDPASARDIRHSIRSFARESQVGVLWTSHNMYEVEEVCDRVLFLSHIAGLLASSIATSLVGLAVMIVVAALAFGLSFGVYGAMLLPFVLVLFLFGMALGIAAIALVLRWGPAAEWFVWPIPALLSPFACVYYPMATLPVPLQWLARLLPPSYVFEGMRAVVAGRHFEGALLAG